MLFQHGALYMFRSQQIACICRPSIVEDGDAVKCHSMVFSQRKLQCEIEHTIIIWFYYNRFLLLKHMSYESLLAGR